MSKSKDTALQIKQTAEKLGWTVEVRGTILEINKRITPNDKEDFTKADMEYSSILGLLPTTAPGSVWGDDGGGLGALSAMKSGTFSMKKSGGSKLVLKALDKL